MLDEPKQGQKVDDSNTKASEPVKPTKKETRKDLKKDKKTKHQDLEPKRSSALISESESDLNSTEQVSVPAQNKTATQSQQKENEEVEEKSELEMLPDEPKQDQKVDDSNTKPSEIVDNNDSAAIGKPTKKPTRKDLKKLKKTQQEQESSPPAQSSEQNGVEFSSGIGSGLNLGDQFSVSAQSKTTAQLQQMENAVDIKVIIDMFDDSNLQPNRFEIYR